MIDEPLKPWQHGWDLDYLIKVQDNSFRTFNQYPLSPFLEMKKNRVAEALHNRELFLTDNGGIHYVGLKVGGPISMFTGYKVPVLKKKAGDVLVKRLSPSQSRTEENAELMQHLDRLTARTNVFLYLFEECQQSIDMAEACGFEFKARQFNTFADVVSIYYKGKPRNVLPLDAAQFYTLEKANVPSLLSFIEPIRKTLEGLEKDGTISFTNHYSNYNEGNAWSAISLRGYTEDWRFIEKPQEMSKKWKEENKGKSFWLQDTKLMEHFKVYDLLDHLKIENPHRIRFMKLRGGEGVLGRHTDQGCPDAGVDDNQLMRLHFPIVTNDKVRFKCWHSKECKEIGMKVGECWYLDTRKPHEATNGGTTDRIHLVIDVPTNEKLRRLFK